MLRIGVLGAGSYGTCLTKLLSDAGHEVALWCRSPELATAMTGSRENADYLPGYELGPGVTISTDLAAVVARRQVVLGVTPSHAVREVVGRAAAHLDPDVIVVNASKGLEEGTLDRIDQIYAEILPARIAARAAYLSGPTFAKEIAAGLPSAIVIAGTDLESRTLVQEELATDRFRVYTSDDVVGVLIGGALKNVVAIAAGLSDGLGFGLNSRAALITRGLAEIARIGVCQGANPMTFQGLSGMGDLVLTCSGDLSRNRRVGLALGEGKKLDEIVKDMKMVAEGVKTTRVGRDLAAKIGVPAPITDFMYAVLYQDKPARSAIADLMQRSLKSERD
ncbi:MAG TPA: NAD(P)H-dependent glycerol-3-phosphate dehydrogenase [Kofleriaceae bacterium]|nr:NAD(P)H-dependent glycerol-3-phosphate dehydrogenase [Kofleriaceae bacterium]